MAGGRDLQLRSSEGAVQRTPVHPVPTSDFGFRDAGGDELACLVELEGRELSSSPSVSAIGFRDPNAFGLAFTNQRAFKLGERGQHVQHQLRESVVGVGGVGLPLLNELHRRSFCDDLVDDGAHVAKRPREPIHRRDTNGVAFPDVFDALIKSSTAISAAPTDLVGKESVDFTDRFELTRQILIVTAHTYVADCLCALRHP